MILGDSLSVAHVSASDFFCFFLRALDAAASSARLPGSPVLSIRRST